MMDEEKIKQGIRLLLEGIGENVNREGTSGNSRQNCPYVQRNLRRTGKGSG